jgi:ubiquinone/menaquinone biosynthesis C-methylase UbiE
MPSSPFDAIADSYDSEFEKSTITQALRPIVLQSALKYFRPGDHILELNCGTGTDAVTLATNGIQVTATDESAEMIKHLNHKIITHDLQSLVHAQVLSFEQLSAIRQPFDGLFSNFGGLNCSPNITQVIQDISHLLKPGGVFIACLLNKLCLWESASFLVRGKLQHAMRRFGDRPVSVQIGSSTVDVRYYTPQQFRAYLWPAFHTIDVYGLNILSPSSNSQLFAKRHPVLLGKLLAVDNLLRYRFPFKSLGDHFVIIAQKNP